MILDYEPGDKVINPKNKKIIIYSYS